MIGLHYDYGAQIPKVVEALRHAGIDDLHLISGDADKPARRMAARLKMTSGRGGKLPEKENSRRET